MYHPNSPKHVMSTVNPTTGLLYLTVTHRNGECPLITAVLKEDPVIINLLLKCGAHLTSADIYPVTEIMITAIRNGSISKLESLKLAGARFDVMDELRQTPLHKVMFFFGNAISQFDLGG